jgi:hypothetical protein
MFSYINKLRCNQVQTNNNYHFCQSLRINSKCWPAWYIVSPTFRSSNTSLPSASTMARRSPPFPPSRLRRAWQSIPVLHLKPSPHSPVWWTYRLQNLPTRLGTLRTGLHQGPHSLRSITSISGQVRICPPLWLSVLSSNPGQDGNFLTELFRSWVGMDGKECAWSKRFFF